MKAHICIALLAATALVLPLLTVGHDGPPQGWPHERGWPEYGGTATHQSYSPTVGPGANKEAAPAYTLSARSYSAPIADIDGNIYVGDTSGVVTKLTAGLKLVWKSAALGGEIRSSLALGPNNRLYVAPVGDDLVALSALDGKVVWRAKVNNTASANSYVVTAAPTIHPNGFILQPSMDGRVYAVNTDGTIRWKFQTDTKVDARATVDNKVVAATAIGSDGTIYVGSQNSYLYAIKADGTQKWRVRTADLINAGCAANPNDYTQCDEQQVAAPSIDSNGIIYVGTRLKNGFTGKIYAFEDKGTSAVRKWGRTLNDKVTAPVAIGPGNALYVGDLSGSVFRLKPSDGSIVWSFNPADNDPGAYAAAGASNQATATLTVAEQILVDANNTIYVPYWHVDLSKGFPPTDSFTSPFYALKADSGAIKWRHMHTKTIRAPLLVPTITYTNEGDRASVLYLAGDNGKVTATGVVPPVLKESSKPQKTTTPPPIRTMNNTEATQPTSGGTTPSAGLGLILLAVAATLAIIRRRDRRA
jgi:outer membrane protein assembly factor BamB